MPGNGVGVGGKGLGWSLMPGAPGVGLVGFGGRSMTECAGGVLGAACVLFLSKNSLPSCTILAATPHGEHVESKLWWRSPFGD
jgi:hypothetical protein